MAKDMNEARHDHRRALRAARDTAFKPAMAELDAEAWRILEAVVPELAEIAARKRALRDLTSDPRIDTATTQEELRALWPEYLGNIAHFIRDGA